MPKLNKVSQVVIHSVEHKTNKDDQKVAGFSWEM